MAYADGVDDMALIGGPGPTPWLYDDRLRLNGLELPLDGALGSHGAWLKAPYADDPKSTGIKRLDSTQLRNLMSRAALDNFQVAVDAAGDAATAEVLGAIEENAETYKGDRRWRIEHADVADPADIARFGKDGAIVSMQPGQVASGHATAEARLGPARLAGAYAWKSIAASGAHLAFGSGAPAGGPSPFAGIAVAMTREDADGQPFGGWQPQEILGREAAFAAYTSGAAYAGFADGHFGELAEGQRADFVVVGRDPLLASADDLRAMKPDEVWIGGRQVFGPPARFLLGSEPEQQKREKEGR
jgi:predicted amidohydrolase YtcJ